MSKSIGVSCPHCGSRTWINGKTKQTPILTKLWATCRNIECSASFTVNLEITKEVNPSIAPVPEITAQIPQRIRKAAV